MCPAVLYFMGILDEHNGGDIGISCGFFTFRHGHVCIRLLEVLPVRNGFRVKLRIASVGCSAIAVCVARSNVLIELQVACNAWMYV